MLSPIVIGVWLVQAIMVQALYGVNGDDAQDGKVMWKGDMVLSKTKEDALHVPIEAIKAVMTREDSGQTNHVPYKTGDSFPVEYSTFENEEQIRQFCDRLHSHFVDSIKKVNNESRQVFCSPFSNDSYAPIPHLNECPDNIIDSVARFNKVIKILCPGVLGILIPDERTTPPTISTSPNVDAENGTNKSWRCLPDGSIRFVVAVGSLLISKMRFL